MTSALMLNHFACAIPTQQNAKQQLIREIRLLTAVDINRMIAFYHGKLGFDVLHTASDSCSFSTGQSVVTFKHTTTSETPHYHFAFNISEQKNQTNSGLVES